MENYFYLFGFIYLLLLIRRLHGYTIPVKEEDVLKIDENTSVTDLMDSKEKMDSKPKKSIVWTILDALCCFWLALGYINNQEDKVLFTFLIASIVLYWIVILSFIILSVRMIVLGSKSNTGSATPTKQKKPIELTKVLVVTELLIVICILIKHYFLI